jgi:F-type H+-transporting ATPase subunit delta
MRTAKQSRRDAKSLLRSCQVNGLLDEARVRQAVQQVIALKPRGYPRLLAYFKRLVQLEIVRRTARIESAIELSPEWQTRLTENLTKSYGPGLQLTFTRNPALLGGLRIAVGSDVFDGSVQGRLAVLANRF